MYSPLGQFACPVQRTRNAQRRAGAREPDAPLVRHQAVKIVRYPILCGRIVAHTQLPAGVGLAENGSNGRFQPAPLRIVHRQNQTDKRLPGTAARDGLLFAFQPQPVTIRRKVRIDNLQIERV